ncbi:hypothetical protein [Bosea sp. MMO-172]|uniref:hypothetical protein n=1 Tax=Bosea sp. MMO-172 TaxID=3127885 RepID=UPI003015ADA3
MSTVHVERDGVGKIVAVYANPQGMTEPVGADDPEVVSFLNPPAPGPTRLFKAELWRRLTEAEADALDAALAAAPTRLRRIFEAAQYLDTADPDYPALRAGIVAALGEARADEVLAPTH